jgi:hypothetical protein
MSIVSLSYFSLYFLSQLHFHFSSYFISVFLPFFSHSFISVFLSSFLSFSQLLFHSSHLAFFFFPYSSCLFFLRTRDKERYRLRKQTRKNDVESFRYVRFDLDSTVIYFFLVLLAFSFTPKYLLISLHCAM